MQGVRGRGRDNFRFGHVQLVTKVGQFASIGNLVSGFTRFVIYQIRSNV